MALGVPCVLVFNFSKKKKSHSQFPELRFCSFNVRNVSSAFNLRFYKSRIRAMFPITATERNSITTAKTIR